MKVIQDFSFFFILLTFVFKYLYIYFYLYQVNIFFVYTYRTGRYSMKSAEMYEWSTVRKRLWRLHTVSRPTTENNGTKKSLRNRRDIAWETSNGCMGGF